MGGAALYTTCVLYIDAHGFPTRKLVEADAVMVTGAIMGLLLVFRTNSAYDRWWEARKLWGQLVNDIRNICIKAKSQSDLTTAEHDELAPLLTAFPYALKDHLRGLPRDSRHVSALNLNRLEAKHTPLNISKRISEIIFAWKNSGKIDGSDLVRFDPHMRSLMDTCGACERIQQSPIAGAFKALIWFGLIAYMLVLPWLLVPVVDKWALVLALVAALFVLGIELLAEEIEQPFGTGSNDLPLDTICATIAESVRIVLESPAVTDHAQTIETG